MPKIEIISKLIRTRTQKMIKKILKISWIISVMISIYSCSLNKKINSNLDVENCLMLDPINYHNARLNPKWLSKNGIVKIIEREYLDGKNGKVHLVNILYFNNNGYRLCCMAKKALFFFLIKIFKQPLF